MTYHRKFSSKCQKMDLKYTSPNYQTSQALVLHFKKKNHLEATPPIYICSLFIGCDKQVNMLI